MPYIIGILALVVVAVGFTLTKDTENPTASIATKETTEIPVASEAAPFLADGTHTTSATYRTPANNEYLLEVSVTTAAGIITDSNIVYSLGAENDPNAQRFEAAYKEVVIGQSISDLEVSRVGGASLTSAAFNEALAKIRSEA